MQAVHVLARIDAARGPLGVQAAGQGQLDQDAVHLRILVELRDQGLQVMLGGPGRDPVLQGADPGPGAGLDLAAHVDVAGRVVAHQHHRQAGRAQALGGAVRHHRRGFGQHVVGMGLPVQNQYHLRTPKPGNYMVPFLSAEGNAGNFPLFLSSISDNLFC